MSEQGRWYVVQTKPRSETHAIENLERQGYTSYCPYITQRKRIRQRWQQITEPLFPRYLFVQLKEGIDDFAPIRSTIGVIGLVRFAGQPANIPDEVIEHIRQQESQLRAPQDKKPGWQPGIRLEVIDGPFAGLQGIYQKTQGEERVLLLLELLGKQSKVLISTHQVTPV